MSNAACVINRFYERGEFYSGSDAKIQQNNEYWNSLEVGLINETVDIEILQSTDLSRWP